MKITICLIYLVFCFNLNSQNEINGRKNNFCDEFEIVDTINFEGCFIFDLVNHEIYFVEKKELKKIKTTYKSNKKFTKKFKNIPKLIFLNKSYLTTLLHECNFSDCEQLEYSLFDPLTSSITIFQEGENEIRLSFLKIRLIKIKISTKLFDQKTGKSNLLKNKDANPYVYSFMYCGG